MQDNAVKQPKKSSPLLNLVLILIVIVLAVIPLYIARDAEFGGADGEAESAITEINPDYEPWFAPLLEPKSGEIESLLFALQAAIGAGIVFYGIGYMKGKRKKEEAAK